MFPPKRLLAVPLTRPIRRRILAHGVGDERHLFSDRPSSIPPLAAIGID
ncbi:hypothetical protein K2X85_12705 [bacterium]|nr:hypothetical protein [bacterium]